MTMRLPAAKPVVPLYGALVALLLGMTGCGLSDEMSLPPDIENPSVVKTPAGAMARYAATLARFAGVVEIAAVHGGILTDELHGLPSPVGQSAIYSGLDSRMSPGAVADMPYDSLHYVRGQAQEARGFVAMYAPDSSVALQAHMYAVEAYADMWLADLFCSGIPLSTVEFDGDFTLASGSTTDEVYARAAELFDSAVALAGDSARIRSLASVGLGRALLAVGRYSEAAAAVAAVPTDFLYRVEVLVGRFRLDSDHNIIPSGLASFALVYGSQPGVPSVSDGEGNTGLDYISSADPRVVPVALGLGQFGGTMYFPDTAKFGDPFAFNRVMKLTVADGIEARLIEAEAALRSGGDWLGVLNSLRGAGFVAGLAPLNDPGSDAARVDLLFRERAFWLFLSGHRQGDLRRLIRNYQRGGNVYPQGFYAGGAGAYGGEVVMPVPAKERELNPQYRDCFHRNA